MTDQSSRSIVSIFMFTLTSSRCIWWRLGQGVAVAMIAAVTCLPGVVVAAAVPTAATVAPARSLRFENLADRDLGTPPSAVHALAQDKQGFIWMGTQNGVYRHDGRHSIIYQNDSADPHSLPGDYVDAIFRDRHDRMWLGTNNGLARFDPESDGFTTFGAESTARTLGKGVFIGSIIDDGGDGLWL